MFVKASKILTHSEQGADNANTISKCGAIIISAIEKECEKDKTMSNLKSKVKEIKTLLAAIWIN